MSVSGEAKRRRGDFWKTARIPDRWAFLERSLRAGAASGGLSPVECKLLLAVLDDRRKQRNRTAALRSVDIAAFVAWLIEDEGCPLKAAVAKAQQDYGVSRGTVFTAMKKLKEAMALFEPKPQPKGRNMTAKVRRNRHPRRSSPI
jgi:hypothetical protein